jgi:geranyl-CoA carboxylase beta subunit
MGPEQAGSVMRTVVEAKMKRAGQVDATKLDYLEKETVEAMTEKSRALANTARLWDDGMIDPRDTRAILGFVLALCEESDQRTVNPNTFGIARL